MNLTQRRLSKVGRLVILTDASALPRSVVTSRVKQGEQLVRELSRFVLDGEVDQPTDLQHMVDTQHYGLVERLLHLGGEAFEVSAPDGGDAVKVRVSPGQEDGFLFVSPAGAASGFVMDVAAVRAEGIPVSAELADPPEVGAIDMPQAEENAEFIDDLPDPEEEAAPPEPVAEEAQDPLVCLRVVEGKDEGTVYSFIRARLVVGRGDSEIVLDDLRISRRHAEFEVRRELDTLAFYARDLGSTNGTFLNEEQLTQAQRIVHGDRVRVGKSILELQVGEGGIEELLASGLIADEMEEGPVEEASPSVLHETKIYLDITDGVDADRSYEFSRERVLLGRGDANVVLNDTKVSRRHAEIELVGGYTPVMTDLASANGTYVNDKRVEDRVELKDGDRLRVGDTVIKFSILRSL